MSGWRPIPGEHGKGEHGLKAHGSIKLQRRIICLTDDQREGAELAVDQPSLTISQKGLPHALPLVLGQHHDLRQVVRVDAHDPLVEVLAAAQFP